MKWVTTVEVIDIETGEVLIWDKKKIREEYKVIRNIIKKRIEVNQSGYPQIGRIHVIKHVIQKPKQYELKL